MKYKIPEYSGDAELHDSIENVSEIINALNKKRDKGLSDNLVKNLNNRLRISQVYNSNAIEGNQLSLRETELILDSLHVNERTLKDELEAQSLGNATNYLYDLISGNEPLTKRTLLEIHGLILENISVESAGVFRKADVTISGAEHKPPGFMHVEENIVDMFRWLNRNVHQYDPIVSAAILHHWITWIHPFIDGNGRVSRLFLNFFLLQKGYPEIIIKIGDRDTYYQALASADNGNISPLVELFCDSIRTTISIYEEFINEDNRQRAWIQKHKDNSPENAANAIDKAKETYRFQYEVWKSQLEVFRALLEESVRDIQDYHANLDITIKKFDIISFDQYLDILEDREFSNTWFIVLRIWDMDKKDGANFIFHFKRFQFSNKLSLLGEDVKDTSTGKAKIISDRPQIKLDIKMTKDRVRHEMSNNIDLVNIGPWKDHLSFGLRNRELQSNPAKIITRVHNPSKIISNFIEKSREH